MGWDEIDAFFERTIQKSARRTKIRITRNALTPTETGRVFWEIPERISEKVNSQQDEFELLETHTHESAGYAVGNLDSASRSSFNWR